MAASPRGEGCGQSWIIEEKAPPEFPKEPLFPSNGEDAFDVRRLILKDLAVSKDCRFAVILMRVGMEAVIFRKWDLVW